jgi:hypothetical protein
MPKSEKEDERKVGTDIGCLLICILSSSHCHAHIFSIEAEFSNHNSNTTHHHFESVSSSLV